jgi:tRNA nucleotidyltransferase (CCA-adding enzyme)
MNLAAGSLMEAGQVIIHPDDPIDALRDLIVSSGWGQIPVIDPHSGEVVGIVTRTDLIKIMTPTQTAQHHPNLAAKLEAALPSLRLSLLKAIVAVAEEKHMAVYIVGGYVRDLLLERPGIDFDLVVEGDALALGRTLAKKYGGRTVTHARFGTAKWFIQNVKSDLAHALGESDDHNGVDLPDSLDLISARTEFYDYPTALPTVESSGIKLDLHRRDFTINTLALRLDGHHYGELHDYWGGLKDLRKGVVRVLHSLSFIDDPTRLLRAARFEQRFGFRIEKRTMELMENAFDIMKQVSGDRLRHEFNLILQEPNAGAILNRLSRLGVLSAIHPALGSFDPEKILLPLAVKPALAKKWELPVEIAGKELQLVVNWLVWLGQLPPDSVEKVSSRLRLPGILKAGLIAMMNLMAEQEKIKLATPSQLVDTLEHVPLLAVFVAFLTSNDPVYRNKLESYAYKLRHVRPGLDGGDLASMGLKPSPHFKYLLRQLRTAWLDGKIKSSAEERKLLDELLAENHDHDEDRGNAG